jgi:uncharacterized NAD(P)/FAD-binding protein YdhS
VVAEQFDAALEAGTVRTLAGRVLGFNDDGDSVLVSLRPRGRQGPHVEQVQYVVNCTGPCADPRQANSSLVRQLLDDGMMRIDSLGLGIDVAPDCAVVSADGHASGSLFYIGPWLKATYWEATAVPDLRTMASRLASRIILE